MILGSEWNIYNNSKEYVLRMDESEFKQALEGKPLYRVSASKDLVGEWAVTFKKFSRAKRKRMNLL